MTNRKNRHGLSTEVKLSKFTNNKKKFKFVAINNFS